MTFPTPYQIPWFQYQGTAAVTDELGNTSETWADYVSKAVVGWDILSSETQGEHMAEERYEAFLITSPDFWPAVRDRFGLPIPSNNMISPSTMFDDKGSPNAGIFEVVGHDVENASFMLWQPGNIILLKRAEG